MGMFDTVTIQCACGRGIEFQSKAGDCAMLEYSLYDAPDVVKADLIGESRECKCGHSVTIIGNVHAYPRFTWNDDI